MQAITVRDRAIGAAGLTLSTIPYPHAAENDVIVHVYAAGFTPGVRSGVNHDQVAEIYARYEEERTRIYFRDGPVVCRGNHGSAHETRDDRIRRVADPRRAGSRRRQA